MSGTERYVRLSVFCPKCTANVTWPTSLSPTDKSRIASEIRGSPVAGHRLLVAQYGFTMQDAKALSLHVTRKVGECHRCRRPFSVQGEVATCENCRSANIDW